jgi:protein subunit release factor B
MLLLRRFFLSKSPVQTTLTPTLRALFSTTISRPEKPLPPRPTILESDITEAFLKGTGPGGQKINKTSSAVQLKHLPTGLVIKCQETRSRSQNRKIARRILAEKIEILVMGDDSRAALKAEREKKKKASKNKKARRKYRNLEHTNEADQDHDDTIETDEGQDERNLETRDMKVQSDAVEDATALAPHAVLSHHKP